jgi:hypothetical protein
MTTIVKLSFCCPSTCVRRLRHILSEVAGMRVHHLSEIACTISS